MRRKRNHILEKTRIPPIPGQHCCRIRRYLKGWFWLDSLSSLPVHLLFHNVDLAGGGRFFLMLELVSFLLWCSPPLLPYQFETP